MSWWAVQCALSWVLGAEQCSCSCSHAVLHVPRVCPQQRQRDKEEEAAAREKLKKQLGTSYCKSVMTPTALYNAAVQLLWSYLECLNSITRDASKAAR